MTRIDRAAWKRIKTRAAGEPKTLTVFKGRATGPSFGMLEQMFDVTPQRKGETDQQFRDRCARRWQTLVRDVEAWPTD